MFDKKDIILQRQANRDMTATEAILNYAVAQGGTFHRKDLLREVARQQTGIKDSAITLHIQ